MRLDLFLYQNEYVSSRSRAANLIELGRVTVNGRVEVKSSYQVKTDDIVKINEDYGASLGEFKLDFALKFFDVSPKDKICLDVGASNGGFTDILLKNDAKTVYAQDIGECALPDRLKQDNRVVIKDRFNARDLNQNSFEIRPQLAVIDVSFISLTLVLQPVCSCLADDGEIIALIKPQFECSKSDLSKKGIILNERKQASAVDKIVEYCKSINVSPMATTKAPHPFKEKNQEYLIYIRKSIE